MRHIYLLLAVLGAVLPMYYFVSWFAAHGFDIGAMIEAWNVSDATTGLVWDLTVAAAALFVWAIRETARSRRWLNLVALPVTLVIGVGSGLPLYLWLRSR